MTSEPSDISLDSIFILIRTYPGGVRNFTLSQQYGAWATDKENKMKKLKGIFDQELPVYLVFCSSISWREKENRLMHGIARMTATSYERDVPWEGTNKTWCPDFSVQWIYKCKAPMPIVPSKLKNYYDCDIIYNIEVIEEIIRLCKARS